MRGLSLSLILAATAACSSAPLRQAPSPIHGSAIAAPLIEAHNRERAAFGSPPLAWDPVLAAGAQSHARTLASLGALRHSPRQQRPGQGENLWIGTRGAYPLQSMVGTWASERRLFRPGDARHSQADIAKASGALGYSPAFDIAAGLRAALPYYLARSSDDG